LFVCVNKKVPFEPKGWEEARTGLEDD